jgi:hypothetical protein
LVNVIARISSARDWPVRSRYAIRCVSTRVLPDPAPARISSGPVLAVTASRWGGLSPASSASTRSEVSCEATRVTLPRAAVAVVRRRGRRVLARHPTSKPSMVA